MAAALDANICSIKMAKRRAKEGLLPFKSWGGPREKAGRKPVGKKAGVSHRPRAALASRFPVHVTVNRRDGLPSCRTKTAYAALRAAFAKGCDRFGFRLAHYSVQGNHMHFIVEAKDRAALSRGMQGLLIRVAKALNRVWGRRGSVFADRYHDRVLRTPKEVRNALNYVLANARHHGRRLSQGIDHFASGWWFDGFRGNPTMKGLEGITRPVATAHTWLLKVGWRRHGLIPIALE